MNKSIRNMLHTFSNKKIYTWRQKAVTRLD